MNVNEIRMKYFYIVLGLLGIIFIVASFLPYPLIQNTALKSLLVEAAIAFFIAITLSFTIDRYASAQFRKEVDEAIQKTKISVLEATFSTLVPQEIFEEMRSLILTRPFIRRDVICYVSLKWPEDKSKDIFEFQRRVSYSSENITNLPQSYTVFAENERSVNPKYRDNIHFDNIVIGEIKYEGEKLAAIVREDERHIFIREEVEVHPGKPVSISVKDTRLESITGEYSLLVIYPTIDLTILVSHPAGLIVEAVARHPSAERFVKIEGTDTLSGWKLKGGILPYQGIKINWYPVESTKNKASARKQPNNSST